MQPAISSSSRAVTTSFSAVFSIPFMSELFTRNVKMPNLTEVEEGNIAASWLLWRRKKMLWRRKKDFKTFGDGKKSGYFGSRFPISCIRVAKFHEIDSIYP